MSNNAPDYEDNLAFDPDINTMPRCDVETLKSEIKSLKELLKECLDEIHELAEIQDNRSVTIYNFLSAELITKIDNAIGEKK